MKATTPCTPLLRLRLELGGNGGQPLTGALDTWPLFTLLTDELLDGLIRGALARAR